MLFILSFLAVCLQSRVVIAGKMCYLPNSAQAVNATACNESGAQSSCCTTNDYCLSNGLCLDNTGTISQQGCTDPTWASSECFQFCKEAESGLPIIATGLFVDLGKGVRTFCCDIGTYNSSTDRCNYSGKTTKPFQIPWPANFLITDRSTGSTELFNTSHTQNASAVVHTVTATATIVSNYTSANGNGHSTGTEAAIGAGIGVPLLLALLGVSFLLYREKKKSKERIALLSIPEPMTGGWTPGTPIPQDYSKYAYQAQPVQLDVRQPMELDAARVGEMDATSPQVRHRGEAGA